MFKQRDPHCLGSTKLSFDQKASPPFLQPPPETMIGSAMWASQVAHGTCRKRVPGTLPLTSGTPTPLVHTAISSLIRQVYVTDACCQELTRPLRQGGREIQGRQGRGAQDEVPSVLSSSFSLVTSLCQELQVPSIQQ